MLHDRYGIPLTSQRIQELRKKHTTTPGATHLKHVSESVCDARRIDNSNFLLPGDKCCYCGLPQDKHR
jgi:hypothetical protein